VDDFESDDAYGQGIDVAVVDSGVTPVAGLDQPGKVIHGPDLSNEAGFANLAHLDTYGHGTHLAGIITGDDGEEDGFKGMATGARIVSLKVANATGETNVAQIIAAIDWVVEHRNTDGLNIRVLNLSLGLDDVPTHLDDPLSAAVERAWDAGIVVVVAAGNRGNTTGGLDSPAVSPYVIAVGATEATSSNAKEDIVPTWTSGGNGDRNPDFVAPGRSLVSLRVPGSYIDGEGRARADKAKKYLSDKHKAPVQDYPSALGARSRSGSPRPPARPGRTARGPAPPGPAVTGTGPPGPAPPGAARPGPPPSGTNHTNAVAAASPRTSHRGEAAHHPGWSGQRIRIVDLRAEPPRRFTPGRCETRRRGRTRRARG
jgi:hypothetical protein